VVVAAPKQAKEQELERTPEGGARDAPQAGVCGGCTAHNVRYVNQETEEENRDGLPRAPESGDKKVR
jgi:hypothetical protein